MGIFTHNGMLGIAGTEITPTVCEQAGRAFALALKRLIAADQIDRTDSLLSSFEPHVRPTAGSIYEDERVLRASRNIHPKITICGDSRIHTPELQTAYIRGMLAEGCTVTNIGVAPLPALLFEIERNNVDGAIITGASTQPEQYNGCKFLRYTRYMRPIELQMVKQMFHEIEKRDRQAADTRRTTLLPDEHNTLLDVRHVDITNDYGTYLINQINMRYPVRIVLDGSNGCAGSLFARILEALQCKVFRLNIEPTGQFLAHQPDPHDPRNLYQLTEEVRHTGAQVGICLDSDGSSMSLVAHTGVVFSGKFIFRVDADKPLFDADEPDNVFWDALMFIESMSNSPGGLKTLIEQIS